MIFLKLGGSLITDKERAEFARMDVLRRLAGEIAEARRRRPETKLLLGHGSGSFGHFVASRTRTHLGASSPEDWAGFAEVWASANRLNRIVVDSLAEARLPVVSFPPSSSALCDDGEITEYSAAPIQRALDAGLIPLIQGDVAFDSSRGSTIVSTESVMAYLAPRLRPTRLLLAGIEDGVYRDFPSSRDVLPVVTEDDLERIGIGGSHARDVTGGMADKVNQALGLAANLPDLEIRIFSGAVPGQVLSALLGGSPGSLVKSARGPRDLKDR
jgi:isopentenyl phosphate kinase